MGRGAWLVLALCACRSAVLEGHGELAVRVAPARVVVPGALTVTNPNPFAVALRWSVDGPFTVTDPAASLAGGASLTRAVSGRGPAVGAVFVNGVRVELEALAVPDCPQAACRTSRWDEALQTCVDTQLPDGLDCGGSSACLVAATCRDGECVGAATTCDDADPCTLDVCGVSGCGHLDAVEYCPESTNPCEVPACDAHAGGCLLAAAPDGTACGPRDCHTAQVCIAGACVTRPTPAGQSCVEVLAGVPAGTGDADGPSAVARFVAGGPVAFDPNGNLYVGDACALRKVSPNGTVTTLAGKQYDCRAVDGFGLAARFAGVTGLVWSGTSLVVRDASSLRRVTPAGLVSTWVGSDVGAIHDGIGRQAGLGSNLLLHGTLARGPGGHLWFVDRDPYAASIDRGEGVLRHVSPFGEVTTVGPLSLTLDPGIDQVWFSDLATDPAGRLFLLQREQVADGGFAGLQYLAQLTPGGEVHKLEPFAGSALGTGVGALLVGEWGGIAERTLDGGRVPLVRTTGYGHRDGPEGTGGWTYVSALAQAPSGALAFYDLFDHDVRIVYGGLIGTLAGPRPDRRIVDGPDSRLQWPSGLAVRDDGVWFGDYASLRRWVPDSGVVTAVADAYPFDGGRDPLGVPQVVGALGDELAFSDVVVDSSMSLWALRRLQVSSGHVSVEAVVGPTLAAAATDSSGRWWWSNYAAAVVALPGAPVSVPSTSYVMALAAERDGGVLAAMGDCSLWRIEAGGATLLDGSPCDGPGQISALAVGAGGDVFTLQNLDNRVRRRSAAGVWADVLVLSDQPRSVAVQPDGALLLLVDAALLRYRP